MRQCSEMFPELQGDLVSWASMSKTFSFVLIALMFPAASCGSHPAASMHHGTIEVRRDVPTLSLFQGIMGIGPGSKPAAVRAAFGEPFRKVRRVPTGAPPEFCWEYHAYKAGTQVDGLAFCSRAHVVRRVLVAVHG
jgi:hypothetical protein